MITRFRKTFKEMPEVKVSSARNSVEVFTEAGRIKMNNLNNARESPTAQDIIDSVIWQKEAQSKPIIDSKENLGYPEVELYYD